MSRFVIFGRDAKGNDIRKYYESLEQIALFVSRLEYIQFAKLWIKDRDSNLMIRWDLFMNPTWHDSDIDSAELLSEWLQAMAIVKSKDEKLALSLLRFFTQSQQMTW